MAHFVDKIKHRGQELVGRSRKNIGKATGDRYLEREGRKDQAAGRAKRAGDSITDAVKHVGNMFKK